MVIHPVIASACKLLVKISDNTDWGSRLATKWVGNHFITLAVPGSIQTSVLLSPRSYSNNINMPALPVCVATFNKYSFIY